MDSRLYGKENAKSFSTKICKKGQKRGIFVQSTLSAVLKKTRAYNLKKPYNNSVFLQISASQVRPFIVKGRHGLKIDFVFNRF